MAPLISQSIEAVVALLAFVGRASDPLPTDVALDDGRVVLALSGRKDVYYTVTSAACSCPASHWRKEPCKHRARYFPASEGAKHMPSEPLVERGGFKPWSPLPGEMEAA